MLGLCMERVWHVLFGQPAHDAPPDARRLCPSHPELCTFHGVENRTGAYIVENRTCSSDLMRPCTYDLALFQAYDDPDKKHEHEDESGRLRLCHTPM